MNRRKFKKGVFLVNLLAIVYNPKTRKILIGRREKDPYIKELTWCFPGGRPNYKKDLEECLKSEVKRKTNLDVTIKKIVFAKTYPEKRNFLSVYYLTEPKNFGREKAMEKFKEIRWVKPTEVKRYFTTSMHPKLIKILKKLEKSEM
jgi:ADP-ribose pyrophosphatase YjhB (NUDIX family)